MSWKASAYIKEMIIAPNGERLTQSEKLVALVLADYHHTQMMAAYPSVVGLAEESLMTERACRRVLVSLEDKGVIKIVRPPNQGRGSITKYLFPGLDGKGAVSVPLSKIEKGDKRGTKGGPYLFPNKEEPGTGNGKDLKPSTEQCSVAKSSPKKNQIPDSRHRPFVEKYQELYTASNQCEKSVVPWTGADAGRLSRLLKDHPGWDDKFLVTCLENRFKSEVNKAEPPEMWMFGSSKLSRYAYGPIDDFGKPLKRVRAATAGADRRIAGGIDEERRLHGGDPSEGPQTRKSLLDQIPPKRN